MKERKIGIGDPNPTRPLANALHNITYRVQDGYERLGRGVRETTGLKLTSDEDGAVNGVQIKVQGEWRLLSAEQVKRRAMGTFKEVVLGVSSPTKQDSLFHLPTEVNHAYKKRIASSMVRILWGLVNFAMGTNYIFTYAGTYPTEQQPTQPQSYQEEQERLTEWRTPLKNIPPLVLGFILVAVGTAQIKLGAESLHRKLKGSEDIPFFLQQVPFIFHPEWENQPPTKEELDKFYNSLSILPPVGGKIITINDDDGKIAPQTLTKLQPCTWLAEEQAAISFEQRPNLTPVYIHHFTVQGCLPDRFKLTALALLIADPYRHNWYKPFYDAPWGKVAPLVHEGHKPAMEYDINSRWNDVIGRTDFLQRVTRVYQPNLALLEELSAEQVTQLPQSTLEAAILEQRERVRLLMELRAFQRLALACHAVSGTAPLSIPQGMRDNLAQSWNEFSHNLQALLVEYQAYNAATVEWFTSKPRNLWVQQGGRFEADWPPIQKELILLEEIRLQHPELIHQVVHLLSEATERVDQIIGLGKLP